MQKYCIRALVFEILSHNYVSSLLSPQSITSYLVRLIERGGIVDRNNNIGPTYNSIVYVYSVKHMIR